MFRGVGSGVGAVAPETEEDLTYGQAEAVINSTASGYDSASWTVGFGEGDAFPDAVTFSTEGGLPLCSDLSWVGTVPSSITFPGTSRSAAAGTSAFYLFDLISSTVPDRVLFGEVANGVGQLLFTEPTSASLTFPTNGLGWACGGANLGFENGSAPSPSVIGSPEAIAVANEAGGSAFLATNPTVQKDWILVNGDLQPGLNGTLTSFPSVWVVEYGGCAAGGSSGGGSTNGSFLADIDAATGEVFESYTSAEPSCSPTEPVEFSETGLPSGTDWSVVLSGAANASTTSSIGFSESNGSYNFSVDTVAGYTASTSSGELSVAGSAVAMTITFTAAMTYPVTFTESGLPSGTLWGILVDPTGDYGYSTGATLVLDLPVGSYTYYPANVTLGSVAYGPVASQGPLAVSSGPVSVPVPYRAAPTYTVSFGATGLPAGEEWGVELSGSSCGPGCGFFLSKTDAVAFSVPNGTYTFLLGAVAPTYGPEPNNGTLTVTGSDRSVSVTFTKRAVYTVTVDEVGLPSSTPWAAEIVSKANYAGGYLINSSTSSSTVFTVPNGSYTIIGLPVSGFVCSTASCTGSVSVDGGPTSGTITYLSAFEVTFTETGLPAGTLWSAYLGDNFRLSTTPSLTFNVSNGTYSFTIEPTSGFGATPSSGSLQVQGSPVGQATVFAPLPGFYLVTVSESGLPPGTEWWVNQTGSGAGSWVTSTTSNSFVEPNGTYNYTLASTAATYVAKPGSYAVDGASVAVPVVFFVPAARYTLTFTETGLPSGTEWKVKFPHNPDGLGSVRTQDSSFQVEIPNGHTWAYVVENATNYTTLGLYLPSPRAGNLTAQDGDVWANVTYTRVPLYPVTITETGLPGGTPWSGTISNASTGWYEPINSTSTVLTFYVPNGSYEYRLNNTTHLLGLYLPSPRLGNETIDGAGASGSVVYVRESLYNLTFAETGLPAGTTWSVGLTSDSFGNASNYSAYSSVGFLLPNGTYAFDVGNYNSSYRPASPFGNVTVNGTNLTVDVTFTPVTYEVTFTETGLPAGSEWWVNGTGEWWVNLPGAGLGSWESTTTTVTFPETNGTYNYTLASADTAYRAASGNYTVAGGPVDTLVTFAIPVPYSVTFTESGLPSGTEWWVNQTGAGAGTWNSATTTISFMETNGSYPYTLASAGQKYSAPGGTYTVSGAAVSRSVTFTEVTYLVTFTEVGLPSGTAWWVNQTGTGAGTWESTTGSVSWYEPNGTYTYTVATVEKTYSATGGMYTVTGAPANEGLVFSKVTYAVTFTEKGLPAGTGWAVALAGQQGTSTTSTITFSMSNGTYPWSAPAASPSWQVVASSGNISVDGTAPGVITIEFEYAYSVPVTETGLPTGTSWGATLNGDLSTEGIVASAPSTDLVHYGFFTTGTTLTIVVPNGTYTYVVTSNTSGWYAGSPTGTLHVDGGATPATFSETFTQTTPSANTGPTILGLAPLVFYGILGIVVLVVLVAAALVLMRGRRPPTQATPASGSTPVGPAQGGSQTGDGTPGSGTGPK